MLKSRKYIGEYHYSDAVILDGMLAIVPEDLFERVQKNKKALSPVQSDRGKVFADNKVVLRTLRRIYGRGKRHAVVGV